jgi:outer membrane murein-binding lipoprotein Lpp
MNNQYSDPRYHAGETIDFKVPAIGAPYQCDPGEYHPASVYAQAGFPGYTQYAQYAPQLNAGYNGNFPQGSQGGYPYPQVSSQYQGYPQPLAAPASLPVYPALDSDAVQERIRNNIDSIMETQKTALLNSKLESLTNKVQSLAQNIESSESSNVRSLSEKVDRLSRNMSDGDSASHIKSLSDKVERLSRNIEMTQRPLESLSSTTSDTEIARKLRRLAAESSAQKGRSDERIPDW